MNTHEIRFDAKIQKKKYSLKENRYTSFFCHNFSKGDNFCKQEFSSQVLILSIIMATLVGNNLLPEGENYCL